VRGGRPGLEKLIGPSSIYDIQRSDEDETVFLQSLMHDVDAWRGFSSGLTRIGDLSTIQRTTRTNEPAKLICERG